jgi:predicted ATPase
VVISDQTRSLLDARLPLRDLGLHRLKDLAEPMKLFQLGRGRFPPIRTLTATNLPRQTTPLVGRERELAEILELLRSPGIRLVTLTGAGGSGKTRLAVQAAAELVADFDDGVWFVGLAGIPDPVLVMDTVAQTLGGPDGVLEHVGAKSMLVVLDNLEHLLAASSDLAALLAACPHLSLLTTSREPLHLSAERRYPVAPLLETDAMTLFRERARAVDPHFRITGEVAEICRRLDCLPLPIELAAARANVLAPGDILARLEQRLPLLTTGPRDAPERQRTLRATVSWSYDLLSSDEQGLFAHLGVFSGGFTLEAAEAVTGAGLDGIASLVDKSLVQRADRRFVILETIREFALERLSEDSEADAIARRHATYFAEFGERMERLLTTVEGRRAQDLAASEAENVRAAAGWALGRREHTLALRLAHPYSFMLPIREAAGWFDRVFADPKDVPPDVLARAYRRAGVRRFMLGEFEHSATLIERSIRLCRELGDESGEARALSYLGNSLIPLGRIDDAVAAYERSLEVEERIGHGTRRYGTLHMLGEAERRAGRLERAVELLTTSAQLARQDGDVGEASMALAGLGDVRLQEGEQESATSCYRKGLSLAHSINHHYAMLSCFARLAAVAATRGDAARAGRLWGAVETIEEETPFRILDFERSTYDAVLQIVAGSEFEAAVRAGRRLAPEHAVEYALSDA